jgi:hypothetical protein
MAHSVPANGPVSPAAIHDADRHASASPSSARLPKSKLISSLNEWLPLCLLPTHFHQLPIPQLGKSLEAELKLAKISNVGIHNLSPGMVTTELLMSGANTAGAKFFINCLGEYSSGGG